MNKNWGANDYCKVLTNSMVHQYMSVYGTELKDLKGLFNALGFNQREVEQIKNIDDFVGLLLKDSNKTQKMRALLEAGLLRAAHPKKQEYEQGYPRRIPSRILALPQTSRGLNFRLLMQLFMSTVPGVKGLMSMPEVETRCLVSENSEFLKKDTLAFFKKLSSTYQVQIQVHNNIFPDAAVLVIGEPIERGTSFYHVQFHTLVYNNFFHGIMMDYVSARQLAYAQEEGIELLYDDYTIYLNNKAEDDRKNFGKKSFQGIDPYDWEEALVTDQVLDCSRISEEVPKKSLMKSLKEQRKNAVPILNQLLEQEDRSESRIIEENFLQQFETPTRKSVDDSTDRKLNSDIELYGNGVSFIMDKKVMDQDVIGVDVNRFGFVIVDTNNQGKIIFPAKKLQAQTPSVMIRSLIDDLLGRNAYSSKKESVLVEGSMFQVSSKKDENQDKQSQVSGQKGDRKCSAKRMRGRGSKN